MFVPRALRLKGVKESQKPKPQKQQRSEQTAEEASITNEEALINAMEKTSTTSPAPQQQERVNHKQPISQGSRFTSIPVTPEFLAQLAAGVELIFTDYAHQDPEGVAWLKERYRFVDGEEKFIHLTAILEHPHISNLKPQPTQNLLRQAIREHSSPTLELSANGFYVRRRPSTYPFSFIPYNSFSVVDDEGVSFWDQRTIYVEPHIRHLCKTPAKVAHWLKEHGQIKAKWLPIQAVHTLYNSCAFVVLSGNVMHEDVWRKWRDTGKPDDWKIMTKVEHTKRTREYLQLLKENHPIPKRAAQIELALSNPNATTTASNASGNYSNHQAKGKNKRKRKEKDNQKKSTPLHDEDTNVDDHVAEEGDEVHSNKRRG